MNDLRFAFGQLLKNSGSTSVAVLTLALGIGANTASFTLVDTVLLKMLPVSRSSIGPCPSSERTASLNGLPPAARSRRSTSLPATETTALYRVAWLGGQVTSSCFSPNSSAPLPVVVCS